MRIRFVFVFVCLITAVASGDFVASPPSRYLMPRADASAPVRLKHKLILRDSQDGAVRTTGTIWSVHADGGCDALRFHEINDNIFIEDLPCEPDTLSADRLRELARLLATNDLVGLPPVLGPEKPKVNQRRLAIEFGAIKTTIHLVLPQMGIAEFTQAIQATAAQDKPDQAEAYRRFAAIANGIKSTVEGKP